MELKYSVDMVRLKTEIHKDYLQCMILDPFAYEPGVRYKMMTSITAYRHNFYIEDNSDHGSCSFWVGSSHNSRKSSDHVDFVLEYNPNKCNGSSLLGYLLDHVFRGNRHVEVKSLDVAVDIPVNILDLNYSVKGNMNRRIFDNGSDDKTYYFRKGKSNGAIKIYNKKRESNLDHELTRYEITLTPNVCIDVMSVYSVPEELFIPIRCINNFQMPINLSGTDKVLVLSCMDNPVYLKYLDSRKRKKIEQILADHCSIDFNYDLINKTIHNFINDIYCFDNSMIR